MKFKVQIMKSRPDVTDDEIRKYMNFDQLLVERQKHIRHAKIRTGKYAAIGTVVVSTIALLLYLNRSEETIPSQPPPGAVIEKPAEIVQPQVETEVRPQADTQSTPSRETAPRDRKQPTADDAQEKQSQQKESAAKPVYVQAEPVNGYPDLYDYFTRELKYPQAAIKDSVHGVVTAVFWINAEGKPEKIQVENSLGAVFDEAVVKVITNMPPWNPATYNGNPVSTRMSVPLTFELKKINK